MLCSIRSYAPRLNTRICRLPMKRYFKGYVMPGTKYDGYERALELGRSNIVIILVSPQGDQNVGSVARSMLNYGLTELRIVSPECDIKSGNCRGYASGAYKVIENAKIYSTLEESIQDLQKVIATSNRPRDINQLIVSPEHAAKIIVNESKILKLGILFGRECSGLTNDELKYSDISICIPTFHHFASLNLAQAVNIITYEFWKESIHQENIQTPGTWTQLQKGDSLANKKEVEYLINRIETSAYERGFSNSSPQSLALNLRTLFNRVS